MVHSQIPLDGRKQAACTTVFIGGFGDWLTGRQLQAMRVLPPWRTGHSEHRAYYHWDGGGLGFMRDDCLRIRDDLAAWREKHPRTPLILCGHSYGGSAAMHILRHLPEGKAPLILITLDAVGRRQSRERAPHIAAWFNVYLPSSATIVDCIPQIGGRWGHCPDADVNLAPDRRPGDSRQRVTHNRPLLLLTDIPDERPGFLRSLVARALEASSPLASGEVPGESTAAHAAFPGDHHPAGSSRSA